MREVWTSNIVLKQNLIRTDVAANGQQNKTKQKNTKRKHGTTFTHETHTYNTLTNTVNTHLALLQRTHHRKNLWSLLLRWE